jgi:DNA mismatch repair protein MutS
MQGTGPPAKMAANRSDLTPMMNQYFNLCGEFEDSLVLFQVGDFYETFCEAAKISARTLEITLTKREDSSGTYPMAGIPIDNAGSYVETLLQAGYRVAIADQVQDPSETSGVVDRAVTRVVTPGTVLDDELLAAGTNNYLACLTADTDTNTHQNQNKNQNESLNQSQNPIAVAFLDISTGEFRVTSGDSVVIQDEIERLAPAEVITGSAVNDDFSVSGMHTPFREEAFALDTARERIASYVPNPSAVLDSAVEIRACGALLAYAEYTQGVDAGGLEYISRISRYAPQESMRLDATALRSLEVFENREGGDEHTLMGVLDETSCALGRRKLIHWLRRPLIDQSAIEKRHDAVGEFVKQSLVREETRDLLRDVYDIERLITRVSRGRANARDLRSLKDTLDVIPELKEALADVESSPLRERYDGLDELADVRGLIDQAIQSEPPIEVTEGGVIREGYDDDLDELRETERAGREWVADLEARERERTSIDSLKVGYNEVHGYYIEVTDPNLDRVPDDYTRQQTLKNSERFYIPDLKRREDEILGAAERADEQEYQLFTDVRETVAEESERVQQVASVLADLDVFAALAHTATKRDYTRPEFDGDEDSSDRGGSGDGGDSQGVQDSQGIHIIAGRHPVVETTEETFVPNDADLTDECLAVITGPNMSGKSTYMRQIALIVLLAQIGSFVPADKAYLPVIDRIFTRVGASDDIAGGRSTFMREMAELSEILHNATEHSLVLLDEVGRGTSTADGRAIARAVTEFIHDAVGATTLFATHYHELTDITDDFPGVTNRHFTVDRSGEEMTFLHTVVDGASSASYGVDVAQLAGVPTPVIERSRALLDADLPSEERDDLDGLNDNEQEQTSENGHQPIDNNASPSLSSSSSSSSTQQNGHTTDADTSFDLEAAVRDLSIIDMTPFEALTTLNDFQKQLDDR